MGRMEYVITYLWNLKVELSRRMHVSTAIINCWSSIIYMLCMVVQTSVRSEVCRSGKKLDQRTGIMHHKVCYICVHLTVAFSFVTINSYEKLSKASIMHVVVYIKIGAILRWQMPRAHVCIIVLVNVFYLLIKVGATYFGHIITHHQPACKAEAISSLHQAVSWENFTLRTRRVFIFYLVTGAIFNFFHRSLHFFADSIAANDISRHWHAWWHTLD